MFSSSVVWTTLQYVVWLKNRMPPAVKCPHGRCMPPAVKCPHERYMPLACSETSTLEMHASSSEMSTREIHASTSEMPTREIHASTSEMPTRKMHASSSVAIPLNTDGWSFNCRCAPVEASNHVGVKQLFKLCSRNRWFHQESRKATDTLQFQGTSRALLAEIPNSVLVNETVASPTLQLVLTHCHNCANITGFPLLSQTALAICFRNFLKKNYNPSKMCQNFNVFII